MRKSYVLADIPQFGRVYDCGDCGSVHVSVGFTSLTLSPDAYMQLVTLIHTSAANFEGWIAEKALSDRDPDSVGPKQ